MDEALHKLYGNTCAYTLALRKQKEKGKVTHPTIAQTNIHMYIYMYMYIQVFLVSSRFFLNFPSSPPLSPGSGGSPSPGGKKGSAGGGGREGEEGEGDAGGGGGMAGSKPHLRVMIPGQKGFIPRTVSG